MATDEEILAQLSKILAKRYDPLENSNSPIGRGLRRTTLPWILPTGIDAEYALDNEGRVVGLKLGQVWDHRSLSLIARFKCLERLVVFSDHALDIPESFGDLKHLEFLWIGGQFRKLPKEIPIPGLDV
jgi:hypothetical protein